MRPKDLRDKSKNKLTWLFPISSHNGHMMWLVACRCGREIVLPAASFSQGRPQSCGCDNHRTGTNHPLRTGFAGISGEMWASIKINAEKRGLKFRITPREAWDKFIEQGCRCALSGEPIILQDSKEANRVTIQTASLDRINSGEGYTKKNIQWVHKMVNRLKSNLIEKNFIEWCNKITKHNETIQLFSALQQARRSEGGEAATVSPLQGSVSDCGRCGLPMSDILAESGHATALCDGGQGCECTN